MGLYIIVLQGSNFANLWPCNNVPRPYVGYNNGRRALERLAEWLEDRYGGSVTAVLVRIA